MSRSLSMSRFTHPAHSLKLAVLGLAMAVQLGSPLASHAAAASDASFVLSVMPIASVLIAGSVVSASADKAVDASAGLAAAGGRLVIRTVEASARGTVYVLERVSDGAKFSVEVVGNSAKAAAQGVGTAVASVAISAGVILSVAGEVLAFVPNALGRSLMHNEQVTR